MAIYSVAMTGVAGTAANPSWEAKPPATPEPAVMEVGVINGAATACTYGWGRGGSVSTQSGAVLVQAEDEGRPAGTTNCSTTWSVAPTVPTQMFRRAYLPATIGAGIIWTFPRGLLLAGSGVGLVQWNVGTSSAVYSCHVVVDE